MSATHIPSLRMCEAHHRLKAGRCAYTRRQSVGCLPGPQSPEVRLNQSEHLRWLRCLPWGVALCLFRSPRLSSGNPHDHGGQAG